MRPDPELVEAIATDLGVDPSFVEKDWYAVRLVATVAGVREGNLTPVFSGGTSLSNASQDPTLIRHVYDVAVLEPHAVEHEDFPELLRQLLIADAKRGAPQPDLLGRTPTERLVAALDVLSGGEHAARYERFVRAMCYGKENEIPKYQDALDAVRRLGMRAASAGTGAGLWDLIEVRRGEPTVSADELRHRMDRKPGAVGN